MLSSGLRDRLLVPQRVRLARMRRGLTQISLSLQLGVSDRTVRKYETVPVSANIAPDLSDVLKFPAEYFTSHVAPDVAFSEINFRAGRSTTRIQREAAVAVGISGQEIGAWIDERFNLPDINVPDLQGESPALAASLLRDLWGLGTKPLPNLVQLCESKGIRVFGLPGVAASVDAYCKWADGVPHIFLARNKTYERTRFDLAHEIGHLVLHKRGREPEAENEEKEANRFASEFLIPSDSVIEYLPMHPTIDNILDLKKAFVVSAMALTYAAHSVGRMTEWSYRNTCITLTQRGFRKGEPDGIIGYERSSLFTQVLVSDKYGRISIRSIAANLHLPIEDVRVLMLESELAAIR